MFTSLETWRLKNWIAIYWLKTLSVNIWLRDVSFQGKDQFYDILSEPTLREVNPDHTIPHASTNDLRTDKTSSQIEKAITELVASLKNNKYCYSALYCATTWQVDQKGKWG